MGRKKRREQRWEVVADGCPSAGTWRVELGSGAAAGDGPSATIDAAVGAEGVTGTWAGSKVAIHAQSLPAPGDSATRHWWLNSLRDYSQMLQLRQQRRVKNLTAAPACARGKGGLLACYYPFTQISRLISFQMGRINWFRLEHQARLIEMNYFPFLKGHLLSRCWMGRGGCSVPIADPHSSAAGLR